MNKKTITSILALGLALGGSSIAGPVAPVTFAAETAPKFESSISVGYASIYDFRGFEIGDDLFSAELGTSYAITDALSFDASAWYGTLWDGNLNELDLTGGFTYDWGFLSTSLLFRQYFYDTVSPNNNEIGLILTTPEWSGLTASFDVYYDFEFEGWYYELGFDYARDLNDVVGVEFGAGISAQTDYAFDGTSFHHVYVELGLPIAVTETATLTPFVRGVFPIEDLSDAGADDLVVFGASMTVVF